MEIATATLFATVPNDLPVAVAGWQIIRFDDGACSASVDTGAGVMVPPFLTDGATVGQVIERARAGMDRPRVIARVAWVLSCGVSLGAPTRYPTEPQQSAVAVPAGLGTPRAAGTCSRKMMTAMPEVKPTVTG